MTARLLHQATISSVLTHYYADEEAAAQRSRRIGFSTFIVAESTFMRSEWQAFLEQSGAVIEANGACHYGNPDQELRAALSDNVLSILSQHGLIRATGPDAESFLQGQLTNDVRKVSPEHSQLSGYCTPKGRMLACFRLFHYDGSYYLRLPLERVEPVLKRLRMFVLRSQVTLTDASDDLVCLGLAGPDATRTLNDLLVTTPTAVDNAVVSQEITAIQVPPTATAHARYELYGEPKACQRIWTLLAEHTAHTGSDAWRLLDIQAGIPTVYDATAEAFVPQMANLQLLQGINFQKGCYTGQEIVARTHYLGKAKRRMYRARVHAVPPPAPGENLFSAQFGEVGKIVDACSHPEGGYEVLAVLLIESVASGTVHLRDVQGAPLEFVPLPYATEETAA